MPGTERSTEPAALRFGVNLGRTRLVDGSDGVHPADAARQAEAAGFDIVTAADHVGLDSPLIALAAAAAVTSRVRLRSYVLDFGFWNAGLLARDVATLDALSAGRVDLGIGLGHMPTEHAAVGLPFPPYAERLTAMESFVADLRQRLGSPDLSPRPTQQPVPLLMAGMSVSGLELAARHADVVGLAGALQLRGRPAGTFTLASTEQTDERVARVREIRAEAGLAQDGFDVLLQQVVVDADPEQVATEISAQVDGVMTPAQLLDSPFVLLAASAGDAATELLNRSRRWGISSWCTHAPSGAALAEVIKAVRA